MLCAFSRLVSSFGRSLALFFAILIKANINFVHYLSAYRKNSKIHMNTILLLLLSLFVLNVARFCQYFSFLFFFFVMAFVDRVLLFGKIEPRNIRTKKKTLPIYIHTYMSVCVCTCHDNIWHSKVVHNRTGYVDRLSVRETPVTCF